MRKKTAALYNPYLDTMGGGERHILSILKVLSEHEYFPIIFWDQDLSSKMAETLQIKFPLTVEFKKNIFKDRAVDSFNKYKELRNHDIFLYVTDGSYFFSGAKKNFVFCMVPQKNLYTRSLINKIKTGNYEFISNSMYTAKWLKKWGVNSTVIYPYIQKEFFNNFATNKEKIILSVGRFFKHLHSKRQDMAIEYFLELQKTNEQFKDYKLILAGNLKTEDQEYFDELKTLANNNPNIEFKTNCSFDDLLVLYNKSQYYWHMAGIDVNENQTPEKVEHLGITPLEAMASGCIVMAYSAGGLKEIIKHDETGYLYLSKEQLLRNMQNTFENKEKQLEISKNAHDYVKNTFSYDIFKHRVEEIIL
jgi:glycosyltransferase involved in cell wall biosynthesis